MFVVSANYSLQGIMSGLLVLFLLCIVYLRDRLNRREREILLDSEELYNRVKSTFHQYKESALSYKFNRRLSDDMSDLLPPWLTAPQFSHLFSLESVFRSSDLSLFSRVETSLKKQFRTTFVQYKETLLNSKVRERLEAEVGDYVPPWWYSNHLGTTIAFGADPMIEYENEIIETEDSRFSVDWFPYKPTHDRRATEVPKIIIFLPGLGLTSKNKFAQNFAKTVATAGYFVAVVGSRGLDVPLKSKKFWHPGSHDDAYTLLERIYYSHHKKAHVFLTGYSAGSNIVQRTALHARDKPCGSILRGVLCICINYDYLTTRKTLEGTLVGSVYSLLMTMAMKDMVRRNSHVHDQCEGGATVINGLLSSCTFVSDYDRLFCKHLHGYVSQESMNEVLSMGQVDEFSVPLLAVQPADDPLHAGCVRDNICLDKVTANPNIIYMEPQQGNHFGFYEGPLTAAFTNTTSYTYPARLAVSFFSTLLEHDQDTQQMQKQPSSRAM